MLLRFLIPSGLAEVWCWLRDRPTADGLLSSYLRRFRVSSRFYSGKDYSLELAPLLPCRYRFPLFFPFLLSRAVSPPPFLFAFQRLRLSLSFATFMYSFGSPGEDSREAVPDPHDVSLCGLRVFLSVHPVHIPRSFGFRSDDSLSLYLCAASSCCSGMGGFPCAVFSFFFFLFFISFFFYFLFFSLATHPLEIARIRAPCERRTRSLAQARTGFRAFSRRSTFQLGKINEA